MKNQDGGELRACVAADATSRSGGLATLDLQSLSRLQWVSSCGPGREAGAIPTPEIRAASSGQGHSNEVFLHVERWAVSALGPSAAVAMCSRGPLCVPACAQSQSVVLKAFAVRTCRLAQASLWSPCSGRGAAVRGPLQCELCSFLMPVVRCDALSQSSSREG